MYSHMPLVSKQCAGLTQPPGSPVLVQPLPPRHGRDGRGRGRPAWRQVRRGGGREDGAGSVVLEAPGPRQWRRRRRGEWQW